MKKTFTIVELMIVIAIFGMLAAIVGSNVFKARIKIKLNAIGSNMTASEVMQDSKKLKEVIKQYNKVVKNQEKDKSSDFDSDVRGW